MLLEADKSSLLLIDVQEKLLPVMAENAVVKNAGIVLKAAEVLGVPITVSEQYPKGLGPTVAALQGTFKTAPVFEKLSFSCWREQAIRQHLIALYEGKRPQIVLCGIEAHICLAQTAIDLAQAGFMVYVVKDAIAARTPASVQAAIERMSALAIQLVTVEMVIFEWLGQAGTDPFKQLSALIK